MPLAATGRQRVVMVLSYRAFAALAGVSHQAVGRAVREGRIVAEVDGIDPSHHTNRNYLALHHHPVPLEQVANKAVLRINVGAPSAEIEARCRQIRAKLALAQQRLSEVRDRYHDRAEAVRATAADAAFFVREFRRLPEAYAPALADHLGVGVDVAGALLDELVGTLLDELGDLRAEATRLAQMA